MNNYTPLPLPKDTAWERKSWRRHSPIWIKQIVDGIINLIKWFPIIWKDRNWDHHYIFEILKFKLIQHREKLVNSNRHTGVNEANYYITICLNLIDRIQNEYYGLEYQEFYRGKVKFVKEGNYYKYDEQIEFENFSGYFQKYPLQVKSLLEKYPEVKDDKMKLAIFLSHRNQKRCQSLLFKILDEKINYWWD